MQPRDQRRDGSGTLNAGRIVVLHLRAADGSGGGPEKTIYHSGRLIDACRFHYLVAYLTKGPGSVPTLAERARTAGMRYEVLPGRGFIDPGQMVNVARIIRREGVAILHCHEPKSDVYGLLLRLALPRLALVSTMHGWIRHSWKSGLYNRLDTAALRFYTRVIAVSEYTARVAREQGIRNTEVIHNAIDTEYWQPGPPASVVVGSEVGSAPPATGAFIAGYVGRMSREKGPADFVRVAHRVLERDPGCEFFMAGDGPEAPAVRMLAEKLGIAQRVRFLGQVGNEEMRDLYRKMHVLVSPSLTEGLPNNVLEACAMEVPVVATRVGGVPEIVADGSGGLLADTGDIASLADLVLRVKSEPALARRLRETARRRVVAEFSFAARVRKLEELYERLAAGRAKATGGKR